MSQYIGKAISLVSNSDIRYVGTLHEINSDQATVSLRNVQSFGTEGRRGGKGEIPPSENVYEFVVFRGSDVKDLKIAESAAPAPPPQPFADPAIMSSSSAQNAYAGYPPYAGYPNQQQPPQQQHQQAPQYGYQQPPQQRPIGATVQAPQPPQAAPSAPQQQAKVVNPAPITPAVPTPAVPAPKPSPAAIPQKKAPAPVPSSYAAAAAAPAPGAVPNQRSNNSNGPRGPRETTKAKIGSDFDFEQSNAKFVNEEPTESMIPPADEFYNKKSSFFDNISSNGRPDGNAEQQSAYERRGEEQRLNLETFGQTHIHHRRGAGRGRGRGRGGRGGPRGGRGGYQQQQQQQFS